MEGRTFSEKGIGKEERVEERDSYGSNSGRWDWVRSKSVGLSERGKKQADRNVLEGKRGRRETKG